MAEQELQSQAMEIKQRFGNERALLLRQMFDVPLEAARVAADTVGRTLRNTVSKDAKQNVFMREGEAAASALREDAKQKYIQSELEEQAALIALQEHLEEFLAPEAGTVTAADIAASSVLSEEQLTNAADAVAAIPDNGNILKAYLSVARTKGYEGAAWHIASLEPGGELEMALTDIAICDESTEKSEEDIASEFLQFAKDDPDGPAILAAAQDDLNLMSLLR